MKIRDKIITVMFCVFIGAMAILTAALPKKTVSENEKRTLADFPRFTVQKMLSGKWESDFEGYISDHFPAREAFAAADAYFMLATGRNGSNDIYKGRDGYLFTVPVKFDKARLDKNISALNSFASKTGIETKLLAVPTAGYIMPELLPANHLAYRDGEIISYIDNMLADIELINPTDEFLSKKNDAQLYYKTDHHWTSEGAYTVYRLWAQSEGITPRDRADYTVTETDGFYGTSYKKSALWRTKPDVIETWEYPSDVMVTIDGGEERSGMLFREHLAESDKYSVYLDGNHGFESIVNNGNPSGKRVLLIKDSYAHCFAPFMAENCSRIDMVDLRYYLDSVSTLVSENGYDEILALYGLSSLCESDDLSILE